MRRRRTGWWISKFSARPEMEENFCSYVQSFSFMLFFTWDVLQKITELGIWLLSEREDFPHKDTKRPNIRFLSVALSSNSLWRTPSDRHQGVCAVKIISSIYIPCQSKIWQHSNSVPSRLCQQHITSSNISTKKAKKIDLQQRTS